MQMRHHTLSNEESKLKLGYHASSKLNHWCRAPPGRLATLAPGPNISFGDESLNSCRRHTRFAFASPKVHGVRYW